MPTEERVNNSHHVIHDNVPTILKEITIHAMGPTAELGFIQKTTLFD